MNKLHCLKNMRPTVALFLTIFITMVSALGLDIEARASVPIQVGVLAQNDENRSMDLGVKGVSKEACHNWGYC